MWVHDEVLWGAQTLLVELLARPPPAGRLLLSVTHQEVDLYCAAAVWISCKLTFIRTSMWGEASDSCVHA